MRLYSTPFPFSTRLNRYNERGLEVLFTLHIIANKESSI